MNYPSELPPKLNSTSSIDYSLRKKAAWLSFGVSLVVLTLKAIAYSQTKSAAILSDALESIVNVVTAIVGIWVIAYVQEPADEEHPYGHGKVEYFSAAFEGGLIFFAAIIICLEAAKAIVQGDSLNSIESGFFYIGGATIINLACGLFIKKVGDSQKSEALTASGVHILSDVKTTVGIMAGLGLVSVTGWKWLDPLMAVGVSIHLAFEGFGIVKKSISGLIDETDVGSIEVLSHSLKKFRQPGIIDIHNLRVIRSGSFHHIDAHLVVPEYWDVSKSHAMTHEFENQVVSDYPFDGEFAFHLDPCHQSYCGKCDVQNCPIRQIPFKQLYSFEAKDLIKGPVKTNTPAL